MRKRFGPDLKAMAERAQRDYKPGDPRTGNSGSTSGQPEGDDAEYAEAVSKGIRYRRR